MYEVKNVLFFLSNTSPFFKKKSDFVQFLFESYFVSAIHIGKIVIWCGKKCPLCAVSAM